MAPPGNQVESATTPSGRETRTISCSDPAASGEKMTANELSTTSNARSVNGREPASATIVWTAAPASAARSRAMSTSAGEGSIALTTAPRAAAARLALPVPQPTSSTWWPGSTPAIATSASAVGASRTAVRS